MDANFTITQIRVGRRLRFALAVGNEASDPVAAAYRQGRMDHLAPLIAAARAVLGPGNRVLDLGAHLGGFALTAAALGCEVLAVEAAPRNAELLRLAAEINHFDSLHVAAAAVGADNGPVDFSCHGPFGHVATLATGMPTIRVPRVRVDDLLAERGWDHVHLIKLDIEGSEIAALRGMPKLLSSRAAPIVLFESNRHTLGFYGHTHQELKAELRQHGYAIHAWSPTGLRPAADEQVETVRDYVAAKHLPASLAVACAWSRGRRLSGWFKRLTRSFYRAGDGMVK
jgi:FkbM family methyltransferase